MELSISSQEGTITLYFLVPQNCKSEDCSRLLKYAYQACREHELGPIWLTNEECVKLTPSKQEVFVCDPFEGEAFNFLLSGAFKCVRVLGPRCLLTCLHAKKPVPELPSPLHNMAMHEIVVTSSGFEKEEKAHLQSLVEKMCGIYSNSFHEGITHLVAKVVGTKKYLVAMEKRIPTMMEDWVTSVWKCANEESDEGVSATQERFAKYTCPVFRGLVICVSQLPRRDKEAIKDLIEKNGGTYVPNLEMSTTSILISSVTEGEKYKHAMQWRIPCLTQDWIHDSVEKGFAMEWDAYKLQARPKASTPTSDHSFKVIPANESLCSTIYNDSSRNCSTHINETMDTDISMVRNVMDTKIRAGISALENLDLQQSYKSGLFLDGCKIFSSGFQATLNEKLRRIFNAGGAIRFNHLTDAVTHVIIGSHVDEHMNTINSWNTKPQVVTADWLVECVTQGCLVDEENFVYLKAESLGGNLHSSPPASSRTPRLYDKDRSRNSSKLAEFDDNEKTILDEELIHQYLGHKGPLKPGPVPRMHLSEKSFDCSTLPDSQQSTGGIFRGRIFVVSGYEEEVIEQLMDLICENGGKVVDATSLTPVHFSIISVDGEGMFHPHAAYYVTHLFIEDCLEQEALLPVQYYHMPFVWPDVSTPLTGCVITTSVYKDKERPFITTIGTRMGAMHQDMFAKKANPSKNVKASTHLLCPLPEGTKYAAAQKWGVSAVTKDWLLKCAEKGYRVSEQPFRVDNNPSEEVDGKELLLSLIQQAGKVPSKRRDSPNLARDDSPVAATPFDKKMKSLLDQHRIDITKIQTPDAETIRKMYPTPGVAPPANDSLDNMTTPETPYGTTWYRNPPSRVRKGIKRALDSLPNDTGINRLFPPVGTPEEVYFQRYTEKLKDIVANHQTPKPPSLDPQSSPVLTSTHANMNDCSDTPADNTGPLTGVIVCTNRKLTHLQRELYQTVEALGGDYRWSYDRSVTHFVHQGRSNDTNREFRTARDEGKFVVAPDWVWMCRDERKRVDEELFPHTHNPKLSLSIVSTRSTPASKKAKWNKDSTPQNSSKEVTDENSQPQENLLEDKKVPSEPSKEILAKQLQELGTLTSVTGAIQRKTPISGSRKRNSVEPRPTPSGTSSAPQRAMANPESESQGTAITWDDPHDREARARLEVALVGDTQSILTQKQESLASTGDDQVFPDSASSAECHPVPQQYRFAFSSMSEEERIRFANIVVSLGGVGVSESKFLDPAVTHVVTVRPTRSEKHLAAIASGKWLVNKSFLESSEQAGYFVDEEEHEWGNERALCLPTFRSDTTEEKLAAAAHRWRQNLTETGKGPFHGMLAIFYASKEKVPAYTRLVQAGDGQVVRNQEDLDKATHCFLEGNVSKVDVALFASRGIPCLPPLFLNELLITHPPPDEMDSCIPEYKEIVANMTSREPSISKKSNPN